MDCYEQILRFSHSDRCRWLKGLLVECGHDNFVLSGPWNTEGVRPGEFCAPLDQCALLLKGGTLWVRAGLLEQKVSTTENLRTAVSPQVACRFAEDLTSNKLFATVRKAVETDAISQTRVPVVAPPTTPPHAR